MGCVLMEAIAALMEQTPDVDERRRKARQHVAQNSHRQPLDSDKNTFSMQLFFFLAAALQCEIENGECCECVNKFSDIA